MADALNRTNVYTCQQCGRQIVTVDRDSGTTPFMIGCNEGPPGGCAGAAFSSWYQPIPGAGDPTHEWYRPTAEETEALDRQYPGMAEHVRLGGLALRPIAEART